jgi:cell division control protein 24
VTSFLTLLVCQPYDHIIKSKSELAAFLIKPVQRICKYPLLLNVSAAVQDYLIGLQLNTSLQDLIKTTSKEEYPYYDELVEGLNASKRITDKINEAQRRVENIAAVENLQNRVEDWKGHAIANFGDLILDDLFMVTKSDVDREYHVFLFEKIILCCKEATPTPASARKMSKSNSILKKQAPVPPTPTHPGGVGPPKFKTTPLLLKGRIFLTNVTQALPSRTSMRRFSAWRRA